MNLAERKSRKHADFKETYEQLCAIQDSCPLAAVMANLQELFIDCNADRIRLADWTPILGALKTNNSLKFVAFRSFWLPPMYSPECTSQQRAYILRKKTPAVRSRDVTNKICRSLKELLIASDCIECLILQGIPLRERDLSILANGITKSKSLQMLSFEASQIGDAGLKALSPGLKNLLNLKSVCLSGCSLTWRGMEIIHDIVQHQATQRHGEAWQGSLRYRRPDLNGMLGLRRIDLCQNALIGDKGAQILANSLKDDLWIKALDLQRCGISAQGADALLSALDFNKSICVIDVRLNPLLERDQIKAVLEKVMLNSGGEDPQYPWKPLKEAKEAKKNRKPIRLTLSKSSVRPQAIRNRNRASRPRRSLKSGDSDVKNSSPSHYPWRTAARLDRYKSDNPLDQRNLPKKRSPNGVPREEKRSKRRNGPVEDIRELALEDLEQQEYQDFVEIKELRVELKDLKRRYEHELKQRAEIDVRLKEMEIENRKLRNEILLLKTHSKVSKTPAKHNTLEDENILESIETSFRQFQRFLDLIKNTDLADLYKLLQDNPRSNVEFKD